MDTQKIYDDFYQLLQNGDDLIINNELFILLQNYIQARLHDFVGLNIPIHFYFREDHYNESERKNPLTGEICTEKWAVLPGLSIMLIKDYLLILK